MDYRHECKHEISKSDLLCIRQRLCAVASPDPYAPNGIYRIRSLYFDNLYDKALAEKSDGVCMREKFRIRYYNGDTSFIRLEKKTKVDSLGHKDGAVLTAPQVQVIVDGNLEWMPESPAPLVRELYRKMHDEGLLPKTIVDYTREPYIYPPGNVRVTFDSNLRTAMRCTDVLNPDCITVPVPGAPILMEVKWDTFLPDIIRDAIWQQGRHTGAFSKYQACRIYG